MNVLLALLQRYGRGDEAALRRLYRFLSKWHHPDQGGQPEAFLQLKTDYADARRQLGQTEAASNGPSGPSAPPGPSAAPRSADSAAPWETFWSRLYAYKCHLPSRRFDFDRPSLYRRDFEGALEVLAGLDPGGWELWQRYHRLIHRQQAFGRPGDPEFQAWTVFQQLLAVTFDLRRQDLPGPKALWRHHLHRLEELHSRSEEPETTGVLVETALWLGRQTPA